MMSMKGLSNKIAALNWRWRIQFEHRGFQIRMAFFLPSLRDSIFPNLSRH